MLKVTWGDPPDPRGKATWEAFARSWLIVGRRLGYVVADGREAALVAAKDKWPTERRIKVYPVGAS